MGKGKVNKKAPKPLLGQILEMAPSFLLTRSIGAYQSNKHCQVYKCYDQLVAMMFGQLNKCLSLREIAQGISIDGQFLKDIGLGQSPAKSTMGDGNKKRDYRVFEKLYYLLLGHYSELFPRTDGYKVIKEIEGKCIKLVDATTISICLQLFEWAKSRTAKGAIKIHTSPLSDPIQLVSSKLFYLPFLKKKNPRQTYWPILVKILKLSGQVCGRIFPAWF